MLNSLAVRIVSGIAAGVFVTVAMFGLLFHLVDVDAHVLTHDRIRPGHFGVIQDTDVMCQCVDHVEWEDLRLPDLIRIPSDPESNHRSEESIARLDTDLFTRDPSDGIDLNIGIDLEAGIDQNVQPHFRINPDYPTRALRRRIEGWVRVQFTTTEAGTVRDAVVVEAQPADVFDEAALGAILRWRYLPRVIDGVPVERVGMQTTVQFQLAE